MLEELLYKKFKCSDFGVITTIFPNFTISEFATPFIDYPIIYCGVSENISKMRNYNFQYVIVSKNSDYDYDLDDRIFLINLAKKKNNIAIKTSIQDIQLMSWSDFLYYWKMLWVLGEEIKTSELESLNCINKILDNIKYPLLFFNHCLKNIDNININFTMKMLLHFIDNCTESYLKGEASNLQKEFYSRYNNNIQKTCDNYLHSPIDDKKLQFIKFLSDLFRGGKNYEC